MKTYATAYKVTNVTLTGWPKKVSHYHESSLSLLFWTSLYV